LNSSLASSGYRIKPCGSMPSARHSATTDAAAALRRSVVGPADTWGRRGPPHIFSALLASYIPARCGASVNPIDVLRAE